MLSGRQIMAFNAGQRRPSLAPKNFRLCSPRVMHHSLPHGVPKQDYELPRAPKRQRTALSVTKNKRWALDHNSERVAQASAVSQVAPAHKEEEEEAASALLAMGLGGIPSDLSTDTTTGRLNVLRPIQRSRLETKHGQLENVRRSSSANQLQTNISTVSDATISAHTVHTSPGEPVHRHQAAQCTGAEPCKAPDQNSAQEAMQQMLTVISDPSLSTTELGPQLLQRLFQRQRGGKGLALPEELELMLQRREVVKSQGRDDALPSGRPWRPRAVTPPPASLPPNPTASLVRGRSCPEPQSEITRSAALRDVESSRHEKGLKERLKSTILIPQSGAQLMHAKLPPQIKLEMAPPAFPAPKQQGRPVGARQPIVRPMPEIRSSRGGNLLFVPPSETKRKPSLELKLPSCLQPRPTVQIPSRVPQKVASQIPRPVAQKAPGKVSLVAPRSMSKQVVQQCPVQTMQQPSADPKQSPEWGLTIFSALNPSVITTGQFPNKA